ncbi:hypothetical protein QFZ69_004520 [Arthrobacter sp. V1I7]|nr:hypothetical protein [Arthrobacter sp. V1I7]
MGADSRPGQGGFLVALPFSYVVQVQKEGETGAARHHK